MQDDRMLHENQRARLVGDVFRRLPTAPAQALVLFNRRPEVAGATSVLVVERVGRQLSYPHDLEQAAASLDEVMDSNVVLLQYIGPCSIAEPEGLLKDIDQLHTHAAVGLMERGEAETACLITLANNLVVASKTILFRDDDEIQVSAVASAFISSTWEAFRTVARRGIELQ